MVSDTCSLFITTVVILLAAILTFTFPFSGVSFEDSLFFETDVVYETADEILFEVTRLITEITEFVGKIITTTVLLSPV